MTRRVPTRRELLGAGAAGAASLVALPATAAAATATTSGSTSSQQPLTETERLQRLIGLELLLVYCYRYVLSSSILDPGTRRTLTPFVDHERAHIDALQTHLTARGGTAPPGPDSVKTANRYLGHRDVAGRLGQLKGSQDALNLLLRLEQTTIGAYFVALINVNDTKLISLVCQIMANEAQHDAMIGLSMPKGTPARAVPYGLVQGLQ
ncbi:MAG TPA: ferritin-like domain-containing protein [Solirubrobacteraceae bacterium]|nr:ferritin-like domain-containing protein [Solirubrobacteraceae bacterium]